MNASRPSRFALAGLACATVLSGSAAAQGLRYRWPLLYGFGRSAAGVGDVDGDGIDDFAQGLGSSVPPILGSVVVHSGRTGADLYTVYGQSVGDYFGAELTGLGDVDHDGRSDFAVVAYEAGASAQFPYVRAHSGATGSVIWHVPSASSAQTFGPVARLADRDGDGADEVLVAITGGASILSGATGVELLHISAPPGQAAGFGASIASAGDIDQDGYADVLVGHVPSFGTGRVLVYSGRTAALLYTASGPANSTSFGQVVTSVGDVTGDGVPDILVGAPLEIITVQVTWGRVHLHSGSDGALVRTIQGGGNLAYFGESVGRVTDQDGDGRADLLVAAGAYRIGSNAYSAAEVRVYSSATGALLVLGESGSSTRGMTTVPDANGDGIEEYVLPYTYHLTPTYAGGTCAVALSNAASPTADVACVAKTTSQGCRPVILSSGAPSATIGDDLLLHAWGLPLGTNGVFFWGRNTASVPFAGGTLCIAAPLRRWRVSNATPGVWANFPCNAVSTAVMSLTLSKSDLAATGVLPGQSMHVQGYFRDPGFPAPGNVGLTGSLAVTMWP